jgi:hypothetical protein
LLGPGLFFSSVIFFTQTVGLLGRVISPSQGRYLHTRQHKHRMDAHTNIRALSGIRTHNPSVRANEDSSCLRPHGHSHRQNLKYHTELLDTPKYLSTGQRRFMYHKVNWLVSKSDTSLILKYPTRNRYGSDTVAGLQSVLAAVGGLRNSERGNLWTPKAHSSLWPQYSARFFFVILSLLTDVTENPRRLFLKSTFFTNVSNSSAVLYILQPSYFKAETTVYNYAQTFMSILRD